MPELRFHDQIYTVDDYDTVLNTLLKNGHAVPNFCRSGYCHSCMMQCEQGTPLPTAQAGLSDELVEENHFLACQCAVFMPMTVKPPQKEKRTRFTAMVRGKERLSENIVRLQLDPGHAFAYQAGQYTTLTNVDGLSADYPIASLHGEDPYMIFDIASSTDDPLSQYIVHTLEEGDGLEIQTALGNHFYREDLQEKPLLFITTDTLLASACALIREALKQVHKSPIYLLHLALEHPLDYAQRLLGDLEPQIHCTLSKGNSLNIQKTISTWFETLNNSHGITLNIPSDTYNFISCKPHQIEPVETALISTGLKKERIAKLAPGSDS